MKGQQTLFFVADKFALQSVGELHLRLTIVLKDGFCEKPRRFSTDVIKGRLHLKCFLSCGNSSIISNWMFLDCADHVLKKRLFFVSRKNYAKGTQKIGQVFFFFSLNINVIMKGERFFLTRRILLLPCSLTEDFAFLFVI